MKSLLLASAILMGVSGVAHAQAYGSGVDGQSIFRVSNTIPPISYTSSSTVSPKLASETRIVRLNCTTDCHFKVGPAGTVSASVSNTLLLGGVTEYFKVNPGSNYLAVIRASADGKLHIDEMAP